MAIFIFFSLNPNLRFLKQKRTVNGIRTSNCGAIYKISAVWSFRVNYINLTSEELNFFGQITTVIPHSIRASADKRKIADDADIYAEKCKCII